MKRLAFAAAAVFIASHALAGDPGQMPAMQHQAHAAMNQDPAAVPREGGQAAFAAIQEIVAMLEADPQTDWSKVNIEALRQHLADMNDVTLRARATSEAIAGGVRYMATGEGPVIESIRRMVFAHAQVMNGVGGWTYQPTEIPNGAALTVKVADPRDIAQVKALGFIGILAKGSHHQAHHLMIASGRDPHS
jgi:NADPH-dependent ferric siderophore reductase